MSTLDDALIGLDERHREARDWFRSHIGTEVPWPRHAINGLG